MGVDGEVLVHHFENSLKTLPIDFENSLKNYVYILKIRDTLYLRC